MIKWLDRFGKASMSLSSIIFPHWRLQIFLISWMFSLGWVPAGRGAEGATPSGKNGLQVIFSGRRNGVLEPCGCSWRPEGGLQDEAAVARRWGGTDGLRLDAGQWSQLRPELYPLDALKSRTMLRALHRLGFDAINVGWPDLQLGRRFFSEFDARYPQERPPLVSANIFLKDEPARRAFAACRMVTRRGAGGRPLTIGMTGIAGASPAQAAGEGFIVGDPARSLAPVIAELRPQVDLLILLCAGDEALTLEVARLMPQVDWIITTAPLRSASGDGRILGVRGEDGRQLGVAGLVPAGEKRWRLAGAPEWLRIEKTPAPDPEIQELQTDFKRATREIEIPLPGPEVRETYGGQRRCAVCHRQADTQWSATPHARALATLTERGQLFNPDCVGCHTTGYRRSNGFYSVKHPASQAMLDVQCEACHGPALRHADEQEQIVGGAALQMTPEQYGEFLTQARRDRPPRQVPEAVCRTCHDARHDPDFDCRDKVKKVVHGHAR